MSLLFKLFPILFDGNLYKYANNNPVNFTDPLGLWFGSTASYGGGGGSWQGTWGTFWDLLFGGR